MKNNFNSIMAKTKSLSVADLKKEGDIAYANKIAREENLLAALKEGKLKSPYLKAEARNIKLKRELAAQKKAAKKEKEE